MEGCSLSSGSGGAGGGGASAPTTVMVLLIIDDDKYKLHLAGSGVRHLKNAIRKREDVDVEVDDPGLVFQMWDTDFEEFVNIPNSFTSIPNKARIRIKQRRVDPQVLLQEVKKDTSMTTNDAPSRVYPCFPHQSLEEAEFAISEREEQIRIATQDKPNSTESWSSPSYRLPNFSPRIQAVLAEKTVLNHPERRWIIEELFHDIVQYTWFPGELYQHAAATLVHQHPHLRDATGNGYESWLNQLRNKFANERRKERMVVMFGNDEDTNGKKRTLTIESSESRKRSKLES